MFRILYIILFIVPAQVFGQNETAYEPLKNPEQLKLGIAQMASTTTSIQTSFKQKKYLSILSNAIVSEGEMIFKKPHALKWAYSKPYHYIIAFKENGIVINDEGKISKFDISSSKAFLEINKVIVNSVSGNILQEDQFDIEYFVNETNYLAKMSPKMDQLKAYIDVIEVSLDKNDFTVSNIKLIEKGNDYTLIDFFAKKLNEPISDATFEIN